MTGDGQGSIRVSPEGTGLQGFSAKPPPQESGSKGVAGTKDVEHFNRKRSGGNGSFTFCRIDLTTFFSPFENHHRVGH